MKLSRQLTPPETGMTAADWQLYAESFFPHLLPGHRQAMVRDLLADALATPEPVEIVNRKS